MPPFETPRLALGRRRLGFGPVASLPAGRTSGGRRVFFACDSSCRNLIMPVRCRALRFRLASPSSPRRGAISVIMTARMATTTASSMRVKPRRSAELTNVDGRLRNGASGLSSLSYRILQLLRTPNSALRTALYSIFQLSMSAFFPSPPGSLSAPWETISYSLPSLPGER